MEVDSYQSEKKFVYKAVHPKVMKVLMKMKAPTPIRLVSDALQPITGSLSELSKAPQRKVLNISPLKIEKQAVTLNLSMNGIRMRRTSLTK